MKTHSPKRQCNSWPAQCFPRSLNRDDKFDEISELVKENEFDVFAVTETWLNEFRDTALLSGLTDTRE